MPFSASVISATPLTRCQKQTHGIPVPRQTQATSEWPIITTSIACQTLSPSERMDEPVVYPPMLKEPVTIHTAVVSDRLHIRSRADRVRTHDR